MTKRIMEVHRAASYNSNYRGRIIEVEVEGGERIGITKVIEDIDRDPESYWVVDAAGDSVWVTVVRNRRLNEAYIRTKADGIEADNLGHLPTY